MYAEDHFKPNHTLLDIRKSTFTIVSSTTNSPAASVKRFARWKKHHFLVAYSDVSKMLSSVTKLIKYKQPIRIDNVSSTLTFNV